MTRLCLKCFDNVSLKRRLREIRPNYPNRKCSFHPKLKGIPIGDVTPIIDKVFRSKMCFGEYSGATNDQRGDPLEVMVHDLTDASCDDVASAIADQLIEDEPDLEEPFYDDEQYYVEFEDGAGEHSILWDNFRRSIVHNKRFFNSEAKSLIGEIFKNIHFQKDENRDRPVYLIEPEDLDSSFFRARVADDDKKRQEIQADPSRNLGPPPERSRGAGRLNTSGVAAMYAAFDQDTCVAELRPKVGSTIVVGKFKLIRPIYVLDTTLFRGPAKELGLFHKDHVRRLAQWHFMRQFMREIAAPIGPNDEHLDYIPTQAVAEYLAHHYEFKKWGEQERIEAIIYKSAQHSNGKNIALLGDAANVQMLGPQTKDKGNSDLFGDALPKSMSKFMSRRTMRNNPATELVDSSVKSIRVHGAQYSSHRLSYEEH